MAVALMRWIASSLGLWLVWFWLDNLLRLPGGVRMAMLAAGVLWPLHQAWRLLGPPLRRMPAEAVAREIEQRIGIGDNLLINACQFAREESTGAAAAFMQRTVADGGQAAAAVDGESLRDPVRFRRLALAAGLCAGFWLVYGVTFSRHAGNAWARLSRPLADIPAAGAWSLELTPGGHVSVWEGDSLTFEARARSVRPGSRAGRPPVLRRSTGRRGAEAFVDTVMQPAADCPGSHVWRAENIREGFAARVVQGDSASPATRVSVRRLPRVSGGAFRVRHPAYVSLPDEERPGPPAVLSVLAGSRVEVTVRLDRPSDHLFWQQGTNRQPMAALGRTDWQVESRADQPGDYAVLSQPPGSARRLLARGPLRIIPDASPEVAFDTDERNRFVWPGEEIVLPLVASDDHGLRSLAVTLQRAGDSTSAPAKLGSWTYQGPPGRRGTVREQLRLGLDPARFIPGEIYRLEAVAADWRPGAAPARSAPVILRIRRPQEAAAGLAGEARAAAEALDRAIAEQRRSLMLTRNLELHAEEAVGAGHLAEHRGGISRAQEAARQHGRAACIAWKAVGDGAGAATLATLVEHEMGLAIEGIGRLTAREAATLTPATQALARRQTYILSELMRLLGRLAGRSRAAAERRDGADLPPSATAAQTAAELEAALKTFVAAQKRVIQQSRLLIERGPEDLTEEEKEVLGELAREEARLAAFLRDTLEDISRNPLQDFADGSLADEFNEIYQEVQKAAESLYARNIELAVPQEQSGLENAEELIHNLEKWLVNTPDYKKWLMEEPPEMPDVPLAELPHELEDIVGELLDQEEAMTEDVEDATSSWIDSLDKGAGWDAADGPMSDMSAKGVTGNQLPNQMEIGGRSGEGRTGRSQGQMVESAAEGKDGRQTPSRVTATPFETGQVEDRSAQDPGGATGGGKLSGFAGQGLRGPAPPPRLDQLKRLAGRQAEIRQDAERLSLHLRANGAPSGQLEAAIAGMRDFETQAAAGRGAAIRRAFDATIDAMQAAAADISDEAVSRREAGALKRPDAEALWSGLADRVPDGYEDIAAAYFRRLAQAVQEHETK